jgi:catechol 2,3-dioxygenase-like lactoylglutathione lyase family enzyme
MEQRVSLITLGVTDLERSAAFYAALGWEPVDSPDGVVAFNLISSTLGLYPRAALAQDIGMAEAPSGPYSGLTLAHNVRDKAEVGAILDRAAAAGATILKPAQDVFWGGFHGYFADPDGHIWEIAFNPFSPLGKRGEFQWGGGPDDA